MLDAVVIGGGPAGATAATVLAQHGRKVKLYERADGPRFHVGESLIPMTYWPLKRMGLVEKLKESNYPKKYSVQFVGQTGKESKPFYFQDTNPHESAVTWQVWRESFDQMLLDNAKEKGVEVVQGASVLDVHFDGERATGVRAKVGEGPSQDVEAKVVIDASGQSSIIANKLKLKVPNNKLRQASVWTYFKDARRGDGIDEGATIIFNTEGKHCWYWFIPLPDQITSIGLVSSLEFITGQGIKPEEVYKQQLDKCPRLKERLENAEQVRPFHVTKDFSYSASRAAGEGWVLVGDALGFIDPVYSTGVFLALKSGEFAADAINEGLTKNDLSGEQLGNWEAAHRKAIESFRKLVYAFYSYEFNFGQFFREHPQFQQNLVDLLVGDVFKEGIDDMFAVMGDQLPYDGTPPGAKEPQEPAYS